MTELQAKASPFHALIVLGKNDCLYWLVVWSICINFMLCFLLVPLYASTRTPSKGTITICINPSKLNGLNKLHLHEIIKDITKNVSSLLLRLLFIEQDELSCYLVQQYFSNIPIVEFDNCGCLGIVCLNYNSESALISSFKMIGFIEKEFQIIPGTSQEFGHNNLKSLIFGKRILEFAVTQKRLICHEISSTAEISCMDQYDDVCSAY